MLAMVGAGCRGGQATISPISGTSVVLAFGDSLTSGAGAGSAENYPAVLAGLIGCRVVNAGLSGEDTSSALDRLPSVLAEQRPDLVILCHGGNDMLKRQDTTLTAANLGAMIELVRNSGADLILISVPAPALQLKAAPFYQHIATQYEVPLESQILTRLLSAPALKSDAIHLNAAGYRQLAEAIQSLIHKSQRK